MIDVETLNKGANGLFYYSDIENDERVTLSEDFPISIWDCEEAFKSANIKGYEPMTAKELETEEAQNERMNDGSYFIEEKFDGTRALVYFLSQQEYDTNKSIGYCRVFSRRISKKTGFYVENTDSLPQFKGLDVPELAGTIIDGEMFIDGLPFKEVSSTLNCLWDKAIDRQLEKGFITLHAFDILFYKGIDLRKLPLERRKVYLHLVVEEANSPYVKEVDYFSCGEYLNTKVQEELSKRIQAKELDNFLDYLCENNGTYPNLWRCYSQGYEYLTSRAYYELIVATGGEGVILKPKSGRYYHKRGWEYSKVKKFLTRDLIVLGFDVPTKEYTGKDIKKWAFWVDKNDKRITGNFYGDKNYTPVTKFYFYKQVGNLLLGVLISKEELEKIPNNKRGQTYIPSDCGVSADFDSDYRIMQVCECAGFDDETRQYFTNYQKDLIGSVVEVKANEIFKDSGKMRHPRYMRMRFDKEPERCKWNDHINNSEVTK